MHNQTMTVTYNIKRTPSVEQTLYQLQLDGQTKSNPTVKVNNHH